LNFNFFPFELISKLHETGYILKELVFILIQAAIAMLAYYRFERRLLAPPVIFPLLWLIIFSLHLILGNTLLNELYPLSNTTFLLTAIGSACFLLGGLMPLAIQSGNETISTSVQHTEPQQRIWLRLFFLSIIIIALPFYIQAAYRVFIASQLDNFLVGIRTELGYGEEDIGNTKYFISLSFVVFAINYQAYLKYRGVRNAIMVLVNLLVTLTYAVLATGRSYFFMILAIYMGLNYLHHLRITKRIYLTMLAFFIPLFLILGIIYGKGGSSEEKAKDNIWMSISTAGIYVVSPINALDQQIREQKETKGTGENTLLFFNKIGQQLGFLKKQETPTLVQEYAFIPYPTNVYTYYSPYLKDYGYIYACVMLLLFGMLHTWIYFKAIQTQKLRYNLYFAILMYPLLMSFFQDQYLGLFSTWIQMIFYIEVFITAEILMLYHSQKITVTTSITKNAIHEG
jgi:oligosaccharide repeat unit polymerase